MSGDSKDCWQCRLISGGGLFTAGVYMVYQGKMLKSYSRFGVLSIGYGIAGLGILRLCKLPPFSRENLKEKSIIENNEDDEYIIGRFSSKFN